MLIENPGRSLAVARIRYSVRTRSSSSSSSDGISFPSASNRAFTSQPIETGDLKCALTPPPPAAHRQRHRRRRSQPLELEVLQHRALSEWIHVGIVHRHVVEVQPQTCEVHILHPLSPIRVDLATNNIVSVWERCIVERKICLEWYRGERGAVGVALRFFEDEIAGE